MLWSLVGRNNDRVVLPANPSAILLPGSRAPSGRREPALIRALLNPAPAIRAFRPRRNGVTDAPLIENVDLWTFRLRPDRRGDRLDPGA